MTISKFELEAAERTAGQLLAHEMCISKIKQLSEQNSKLLDEKIKLDGKLDELYGLNESVTKACHGYIDAIGKLQYEAATQQQYIEQVIIDNVELTEQNKQMKQDLKDWQIHIETKTQKFTKQAPIVNGVDDLPSY